MYIGSFSLCIRFLDVTGHWTFLRKRLDGIGDFYLTVSPTSFHFESVNAEINTQISYRRTEFEKPIETYTITNIFGRHALSSDGHDWRRQRKIISPGFTEKNNANVWELGLKQGQSMLEYWASKKGNSVEEMRVGDTAMDTATLALHIICGAGFGIPQIWPHEDESVLGDREVSGFNTRRPAEGHKLTFKDALTYSTSLKIAWFSVLPEWFLSKSCIIVSTLLTESAENSPFRIHKKLILARDECLFYFRELVEQKRNYRRLGFEQDATDLISKLS
jgi:cytochrome P450